MIVETSRSDVGDTNGQAAGSDKIERRMFPSQRMTVLAFSV